MTPGAGPELCWEASWETHQRIPRQVKLSGLSQPCHCQGSGHSTTMHPSSCPASSSFQGSCYDIAKQSQGTDTGVHKVLRTTEQARAAAWALRGLWWLEVHSRTPSRNAGSTQKCWQPVTSSCQPCPVGPSRELQGTELAAMVTLDRYEDWS